MQFHQDYSYSSSGFTEATAKDDSQTHSFDGFSSPEASSTNKPRPRPRVLKFEEMSFPCPRNDQYIQDGYYLCPPGYNDRYGEPCSERFERARDRKKHIRNHVKPVLCRKCQIRTATQRDMERHMKTHSKNRERFRCDICSQTCARFDLLERHVKKQHEEVFDSWRARNPRPSERIQSD